MTTIGGALDGSTPGAPPAGRILVLETMPAGELLGPESSGTGWLRRLLPACRLVAIPAYDGVTALPDASAFDAAIVPGSVSAVYERAAWMLRLEAYLRGLHDAEAPTLGICFGQQILASALGGEVIRNPLGREFGFCDIRLTEVGRAHPLFSGLPPVFRGAQGHYDVVSRLPAGSVVLAENDYGVQSFALGSVLGVQFHPEMSGDVLATLALHDASEFTAQDIDPVALATQLRLIDLSEAAVVPGNFVRAALARRGG